MGNSPGSEQLRVSVLGDELTIEEAEALATKMGVKRFADGELLVSVNNTNLTLFILVEGRIAVIDNKSKDGNVMYTMKKGECAGTRAFVDRTPRKATLRALGDTTVYTLEPDDLEALLDTHPRIVYKVMRALFRSTHTNLMRMNLESEQLVNYISKTQGRY
uniref:Cyclic nucleotide-binding domain-containing protein n=2 Tax=unclassified Candidatus Kentrum TaxID=2643149 RepID=A0A451A076_9GAMM|nr:MAG: Cyclic nucleotide-binding domain-containing protein [Candidatus Kentron sp. LPFa]VFK19562.1 MAG: Cyclic nucleotide-binding domain-containing protein [Candidatus Kentron sp. LPFa]VFK33504.1 MAG: Cyclic nucleotide-binding domain-containing protein [Candidatus Kentron sp. LPFa]VFK59432.1 MAG: Cyclic nucleotide-binding domain-containing protein [Candidatus Kentron sp. UNK]VFK68741.1 MAG: Cyclic nucleotide-binding domain-containing protein [Candidatus Kentron sp. UNK]